jgi:hypothetical protein
VDCAARIAAVDHTPTGLIKPLSVKQALELVALWLAQPTAAIIERN